MNKKSKYTVKDFVLEDNHRSLFPLDCTKLYIHHGFDPIRDYIYNSILDETKKEFSFLSAPVAYALKDRVHLRKLLFLDPISSFYLYDLVFRNSAKYQSQRPASKRLYGYSFKNKRPLPPSEQYHAFRKETYVLKAKHRFFAKLDISNCFNSFYHHDVALHLSDFLSEVDGKQGGQFLREINIGTSINCFPQGIYPAKTIGNYFLSFIEQSCELRCPSIIRFLDDVYVFGQKESDVEADVLVLQQILGNKNLFLNAQKSLFGSRSSGFDERAIDDTKKILLAKREDAIDYDGSPKPNVSLEGVEREYLEQILIQPRVAEEDLELALSLIKEGATIVRLLELVCEQHPQLLKLAYPLLSTMTFDDEGACWSLLEKRIESVNCSEFELFWIAKIIIDVYDFSSEVADLLHKVYAHRNAKHIRKYELV
jgi:hypothetical protein